MARTTGLREPAPGGAPGGAAAVGARRPRCPGGRGGGPPALTGVSGCAPRPQGAQRSKAHLHRPRRQHKHLPGAYPATAAGRRCALAASAPPRAPQALENAANHADLPPHRPHMQVDDAYVVRRPAPPAICCVCQVAAPPGNEPVPPERARGVGSGCFASPTTGKRRPSGRTRTRPGRARRVGPPGPDPARPTGQIAGATRVRRDAVARTRLPARSDPPADAYVRPERPVRVCVRAPRAAGTRGRTGLPNGP